VALICGGGPGAYVAGSRGLVLHQGAGGGLLLSDTEFHSRYLPNSSKLAAVFHSWIRERITADLYTLLRARRFRLRNMGARRCTFVWPGCQRSIDTLDTKEDPLSYFDVIRPSRAPLP
jgi:hypothetical protein